MELSCFFTLVRFQPVLSPTGVSNQWDAELASVLHLREDDVLDLVFLFGIDAEVEFVVHLQDHLGAYAFFFEASPDAYHGNLDDVGFRTLNGRIDGIALSEAAHGAVFGIYVRQIASPAKHRLGVFLLACCRDGTFHKCMDLGEGSEIVLNELPCLTVGNAHALCQTKGRDAVDDAEVGLLSLLALCVGDLIKGFFPYLGSGGAVNIQSLAERLYHVLVTTKVSHDAQLYLAVVSGEEETARLRHEALADLLSVVIAHGNVLQVGV